MAKRAETSFGAGGSFTDVVGAGHGESSTDVESGSSCFGCDPQCEPEADWNNWRCCGTAKGAPLWLKLSIFVSLVLLVIVTPIIFAMKVETGFNFNSVVIGYGGEIWGTSSPGWAFPGIGSEAIEFDRYDAKFNYSNSASPNDPIYLEIAAGKIDIDVFVYYHIPKDEIEQIYIDHKTGVATTIAQNARSTIRETVSTLKDHPRFDDPAVLFHQWFHDNIDYVEATMREDLKIAIKAQVGVDLTGFYLLDQVYHSTIADTALENALDKLVSIRTETEKALDEVYKENNRTKLLSETQRQDFTTKWEKETLRQEEEMKQNKTKVEQDAINKVKEIQENSKKEIAVYELGTQASIQVIEQEISEARQATKRLVDEIEISSTAGIAVKTQENQNLKLNYTNQANLWEQRGQQAVAELRRHTEEQVSRHEYDLAVAMSEAEKEVSVLLATTRENAENERINALRLAYTDLPAEVLLAQYAANATMKDVRLMDASPDTLVGRIHNLTHGDL